MRSSELRRERENRRRAGYREVILRAAERVILRKGFSALTMDDIAREVQLSKATIYKYVPGKGALLHEIMGQYFDDFLTRLKAILAGPGAASEKLRTAIQGILQDQEDKREFTRVLWMDKAMLKLMRVFVQAPGKGGPAAAADRRMIGMFRQKRQEIVAVGASLFDQGVASGEFRRMDTTAAAAYVEAVVQGYGHSRFWDPEPMKIPEAAAALTRFIVDGIRNPEQTAKEN